MRDYPADRAPWCLFCTYLSHPHSRGNSRGGLPTSLSSSSSDSFTHWASHVWGTGTHHHHTNVNNLGVSETVLQLWETERDREKSGCGYIMYVGVGVCAGFCLNDHIAVTSLKPHRLPPSLSLLVPKIMASLYNCVTMRTPLPSSLAPVWLGVKHLVTYFPPSSLSSALLVSVTRSRACAVTTVLSCRSLRAALYSSVTAFPRFLCWKRMPHQTSCALCLCCRWPFRSSPPSPLCHPLKPDSHSSFNHATKQWPATVKHWSKLFLR